MLLNSTTLVANTVLDFAESGSKRWRVSCQAIETRSERNYGVGVPPTLAQLSKTDFGF